MAGKSKGRSSEPLADYAAKRDFARTPEPSGARRPEPGPTTDQRFVIQMHRATRLHYDFRLEADGVLKSWAVPKGPSLDPADKRLAVHVEDHPLDYADFEGIIPKGNYGAGEVIVWDRGTYRLLEGTDATAEIAAGKIKFILNGKKLQGMFTLVKTRGRDGEDNAWLIIKDRGDGVDPTWKIEDHSASVISGKTLRDIANDPSAPHWISRAPGEPQPKPLPTVKQPMLATLVGAPFDDDGWLFELKWDGYRALCTIESGRSYRLVSRNGTDFTPMFPEFSSLPQAFGGHRAIVDGEIVVLDEQGRASFSALQKRLDRFGRGSLDVKSTATFVAFDLLALDGQDCRQQPLEERKRALEALLIPGNGAMYSKHVVAGGKSLYEVAERQGLEGIVAKRRASVYQERRSRDWLKIKTRQRQEFVIGGWTAGRGSRTGFGALMLGLYEGTELVYVGSVGTGFDEALLTTIARRLKALATAKSPFAVPPKTQTKAHWVEPVLVGDVSFSEWTSDAMLRQAVFIGLREDKPPLQCVRERSDPATGGPSETAVRKMRTKASRKPAPATSVPSAAQRAKRTTVSVAVAERGLVLSNQNKVLWPDDGYTKGDLVDYYRSITQWIIPHLAGRPLTLERFPNGIDRSSFFEKHAPKGLPNWVPTVRVPSEYGQRSSIDFIVCNDEPTLTYVANLAAIVLHVWTSREGSLDVPDFVFFDLDPWQGCTPATLGRVALAVRDALAEIGLNSLVKTSGGSGLHVVVPLRPLYTYDVAKQFAELVARQIHARLPALTTLQRTTAKRPAATVYLDYVQVGEGKTMVAPYSVRARSRAPVSMPLDWGEVEALARKRSRDPEAEFARWTMRNVPKMLADGGDRWDRSAWEAQEIESALRLARAAWTK